MKDVFIILGEEQYFRYLIQSVHLTYTPSDLLKD